jgi:hypothetical protein
MLAQFKDVSGAEFLASIDCPLLSFYFLLRRNRLLRPACLAPATLSLNSQHRFQSYPVGRRYWVDLDRPTVAATMAVQASALQK